MFSLRLPALLTALVLIGCAKEKEYDTVYKDVDIQSKSAIKTHKMVQDKDGNMVQVPIKYMYVPMSLGTPRKVRSAYPFFQGDEKLVRLDWSEDGLEVLEMEKDERFAGNVLNDSPVLTIPVEYKSYRCKEDQFDDCTNAEEENTELEWHQKDKFIPSFEDISVTELNTLDVYGVRENGCATEEATKVRDYEVSDGVINVEIEKTYRLKNSFYCILENWINDDFSSNSYKVRYFFSLVELEQLATPGYEPIDYPTADHDEFGFFKSKISKLSPDYDPQRKEERYMVNRWAPNRENNELVYYLSKNFSKPENKILLEATKKGVATMNKGLESIGNPFKIVIKEQTGEEVSPGDLRYNQLVLIEDPLSNGLLGYGPSVKNPLTGEIVKAHVNMYGGVLKAISRRAYDEAVDLSEKQFQASQNNQLVPDFKVAASAFESLPATLAEDMATIKVEELVQETQESAEISAGQANIPAVAESLEHMTVDSLNRLLEHRLKSNTNANKRAMVELLQGNYGNLDDFDIKAFEFEKEQFGLAVEHKHRPEFFPIGGTTKKIFPELLDIPGIKNENGVLKRWVLLNPSQREQAVNIIIEKAWTSTLIHEFGHNLGLRHNFSGSFDRHNFMSDSDLSSYGISTEERPAYSSIMDYAISEYNQLSTFGNYDLAALRFAYKREVEVLSPQAQEAQNTCEGEVRANNNSTAVCKPETQVIKVKDTLANLDTELSALGYERKAYAFCTDENAGLSSTCNRFDEGTTLTEIAKFRVERYENAYKYRNFRDGRLDFSAYDVPSYLFWRRYELSQIRDILEEYEFFKGIFDKQNPQIMINGCSDEQVKTIPVCGMINDRIKSVEVVADALVNVLKTPDHICATVKASNPTVVVSYKKLFDIYDEIKFNLNYVPKTCFDPAVKAHLAESQLIPVGETGKFLNGFKDMDPNFKYVTDRAVLGTWPDKLMAVRALFNRNWKNRTTDRAHLALVDIPSVRQKVVNVFAHQLLGSPLNNPLPFKMENGNTFQIPYVIGNDYKVEQLEDVFWWVKKRLGMDWSGENNLIKLGLLQSARGTSYGEEYRDEAYAASNIATVRRYDGLLAESLRVPEFSYLDIDDRTYYANSTNMIAKFMMDAINTKAILDGIEKELIQKVLKQRTNPDAPADLPENEAVFFAQPEGLHNQLLELAQQGADIPLAAFVQALGQKDGPKVHSVYKRGFEVMKQIVDLKKTIMTTPAADASDVEKSLFEYSVDILSAYVNGGLTDEMIGFYKGQIQKMPLHRSKSI